MRPINVVMAKSKGGVGCWQTTPIDKTVLLASFAQELRRQMVGDGQDEEDEDYHSHGGLYI